MGVFAKVAGAWVEIGGSGGMPWAKVSGGTVTTVNNPDGSVDEVHTFTADGTLTVDTPGYARVLLVGAGGGGGAAWASGGEVTEGYFSLPSGSHAVTVPPATTTDSPGKGARLGSVLYAAGGTKSLQRGVDALRSVPGAATGTPEQEAEGRVSDISGTSVQYAMGSYGAFLSTTPGSGGSSSNGKAGIVIVRVQKSAPTVSGVVASGGTETTYVGDGVNGVLGQTYKVHTFTGNGNLVVTQGGEADVLLCGGGHNGTNGDGGTVWTGTVDLSPGTVAATIGAAAQPGGHTRFGSLGTNGGVSTGQAGAGQWRTGSLNWWGVPSYISGTLKEYGIAAGFGVPGDIGQGGSAKGSAGVVIVRYKVAA